MFLHLHGRAACIIAAVSFLAGPRLATAQSANSDPLFGADTVLHLQLVTDLKKLIDDNNAERNGEISYARAGQDSVTFRLKVITDRRDVNARAGMRTAPTVYLQQSDKICEFPPLRLELDDGKSAGTVFEDHTILQLVTHCEVDDQAAEQWAVQQYLIYRTLEMVSDWSLHARLVRVTYVDEKGKRNPVTKYAALIEDPDHMAARLDGQILEMQGLHPLDIDAESMVTMALFQFMNLNTDWGVSGLHNIKIVAYRNVAYPVPYDFLWSGVIDAPYAKPHDTLPIRDVRDPLYRGFCRPDYEFTGPLARFNEQKEAILRMVRTQEGLDPGVRDRLLSDYETFYATVNDRDGMQDEIMEKCREDSR